MRSIVTFVLGFLFAGGLAYGLDHSDVDFSGVHRNRQFKEAVTRIMEQHSYSGDYYFESAVISIVDARYSHLATKAKPESFWEMECRKIDEQEKRMGAYMQKKVFADMRRQYGCP